MEWCLCFSELYRAKSVGDMVAMMPSLLDLTSLRRMAAFHRSDPSYAPNDKAVQDVIKLPLTILYQRIDDVARQQTVSVHDPAFTKWKIVHSKQIAGQSDEDIKFMYMMYRMYQLGKAAQRQHEKATGYRPYVFIVYCTGY